ncbi:Golgi phosphoenolpyruvate transmembrane transporter Pet1 [Schizosaccharomyces pombe]|uniref:Uncharacterized transporter C22F8.04 n=1 Tax=Schizosaccharomyces pombe (strain 972 / ATCC 24843) TaxID=284812 RepID=YIY4_SCHPO|nr:putative triose phosphate transporter [Schizosaccharomyces pombe]Q9UUI8.1 RecName: Full=Uncharacterized transporter C22F8.04 [Schizosaccharomyces pombe 972h-]CAB52714.1 triose phosphate transporter (predicted) [Schizosaccharomyces pombe]|eukprot:NP_594727.1 putative triose phosphate transporter [Schizosaccharomyces pombe]
MSSKLTVNAHYSPLKDEDPLDHIDSQTALDSMETDSTGKSSLYFSKSDDPLSKDIEDGISTRKLEEMSVLEANAKEPDSENAPVSRLTIFFAVSSQIVFAILVTILNKQALNIINAPLLMLSFQMAFTSLMVKMYWRFSSVHFQTLRLASAIQLKKFIFVKILGIVSKTYCLAFVPVSFYQISRGLLLPFTILLSFVLLKQKTRLFPFGGCLLVMLGFGFGVRFESHVAPIGIILGVWSSFTTAIESVAVKHYVHEYPTLDLIYIFSALMSVFCLLLSVASLELLHTVQEVVGMQAIKFFIVLILSSLSNFYLNIATFTQIKVTSPVTYMISVSARSILQTLLAVAFLGETLYGNRIYGVILILVGTLLYTLAKEHERRVASA